jgi:hypothetical protein
VPSTSFEVRHVAFDDPRADRPKLNVLYFFIANGKYMGTAEEVRLEGFNISDEYSFYCKIEVQPLGVEEATDAQQRTRDLLSALLPEVMTCLPDWVDVRAGRYPLTETPAKDDFPD